MSRVPSVLSLCLERAACRPLEKYIMLLTSEVPFLTTVAFVAIVDQDQTAPDTQCDPSSTLSTFNDTF